MFSRSKLRNTLVLYSDELSSLLNQKYDNNQQIQKHLQWLTAQIAKLLSIRSLLQQTSYLHPQELSQLYSQLTETVLTN